MKKVVSLLLCIILLMPAFCVNAEVIGVDVPYTINFSLAKNGNATYKISSTRDLYRFLDLAKRLKTTSLYISMEDDMKPAVNEVVEEFYIENKTLFAHKKDYPSNWTRVIPDPYTITDYGDTVAIDLTWLTWELDPTSLSGRKTIWNTYDGVPVIKSVEEFYNEIAECKKNKQYDEAFLLDSSLITYNEFKNNGLDSIYNEIMTTYGEDVSGYVADTYRDMSLYKVIVSIKHPSDAKEEQEKIAEERFVRILANNTIVPITDDMTEEQRLKTVIYSTSNVCTTYKRIGNATAEQIYSLNVGMCGTYQRIFKYFCDIYGVEAININGTYKEEDHAWSGVKYQGKWYIIDTTSMEVMPYDTHPDYLAVGLMDAEAAKDNGYAWAESNYPEFNNGTAYIDSERVYEPVFPETAEEYDVIEPYTAKGPMSSVKIYYKVVFDKSTGTIYKINTNLNSDTMENVDGTWVKKETVLRIPSEVDGVKVQKIASYTNDAKKIYNYDHMYIPEGIIVDDFAFNGLNVVPHFKNLHIGDNVVLGFDSLPTFTTLDCGENVLFKGSFGSSIYDNEMTENIFFGNAMVYYSREKYTEHLKIPEKYTVVSYGNGNNIVDREPVKTLEFHSGVTYIDPRLNRLNRKFIVAEDNENYTSVDGVLYNKDMTELISVPIGVKRVNIPSSVTHIGEYAFSYCNEIEEIRIPASVQCFGNRAFYHLSNLKKVVFEGDVPESFNPILCCDFDVISLKENDIELIDYIADDMRVELNTVPSGGKTFIAFYDYCGRLFSVKEGAEADIPLYATSYKIFVWNKNASPLTLSEKRNLE